MVTIYQWSIYWANLNPVTGSEQAGRRPVVVVSCDEVNSLLNQVNILPLSSVKDPARRVYLNEVRLLKESSGLPKDSIVLAHQIRTLDKSRLEEKCGEITDDDIREKIRTAINYQLGIIV